MSTKMSDADIQKRDNYICQYCGKDGLASLDNWHDCTIDHFIPAKHNGTNDSNNRITSCGYCNSIKAGKEFDSIEDARKEILKRRQELEQNFLAVRKTVRGI